MNIGMVLVLFILLVIVMSVSRSPDQEYKQRGNDIRINDVRRFDVYNQTATHTLIAQEFTGAFATPFPILADHNVPPGGSTNFQVTTKSCGYYYCSGTATASFNIYNPQGQLIGAVLITMYIKETIWFSVTVNTTASASGVVVATTSGASATILDR
ncbi:hypothetical protein [Paenibacillus herberti]|uniref:Uncharacterized protein n=1 Tax=Paenibacillus herberti TaxID=1619309 RepID=A0A229NVT4_9BACL|nr:hypothetical protein [Paenibacillus herberti]OXM13914.1 hypothetical protein CGZ75_12945 [Paenibacillus herberti]